MIKRNLYLHIGCEKTGTTSIQDCLYMNQANLRSNGYYFLQSMGNYNNRKLACYSIEDKVNDDLYVSLIKEFGDREKMRKHIVEELENEIENIDSEIQNVIISSEHFSSRLFSTQEIQSLKNLLDNFFEEIKIICYFREQSKTCQSLFSTGIKSGSSNNFEYYIDQCNLQNPYYNYLNIAKVWADVFGRSNLKIRIFERKNFKNGSVLNDFFDLISSDLINFLEIPKPSNESLNRIGQEIGIAVNLKFNKIAKTEANLEFKKQILHLLSKNFKGKGRIIERKDFERIYFEFEENNIKLNSFLGGESVNCFKFELPESDYEYDKPDFYDFLDEILNLIIIEKEYDINHYYKIKRNLEMLDNLEKINFNSLKLIKKIKHFKKK